MKEVRYSAKIKEQQTLSNAKGVGPKTDELKNKFKEGSIPLQIDFNQLIDIADVGRKACGQAPEQNGPGEGLKLDDSGTLSLKIGTLSSKDFSPLTLKDDVLSVDLGSGLTNETNGICVGQGNGITVNTSNVAVKQGNGISVTGSGVAVTANASKGISVDSSGVAVKVYANNGISVDGNGVAVKVNGNKGISVDSSGVAVKVKANGGIKVDANGVAIDPNKVLPAGMIVMFSGRTAPEGWAFCDGSNSTPDLRSRFVMCGETISEAGKSSSKASGSGSTKSFSRNTTSTQVSVTVNVQNTTLTASQIPSHKHIGGMSYYNFYGMKYSYSSDTQTDYQINNKPGSVIWLNPSNGNNFYPYTSNTGGGQGHNHQATASSSSHNHNIDVVPPYYLLAFIMKL
ncbi:tail fiber protein [Xenorhabdus miraniensis]|uniref:Phage tail collar domain-containing protein n=1 Tax=Xenorhabdus miraniensis TaxID=351674 RepID=A0A2D0JSI3_9GAMM|nr:tail fiber protein [Xenorhabdus miraniensis]PHM49297.1 hypothetical protein Xmir_01653 [Xenorhabdus miraniensis]